MAELTSKQTFSKRFSTVIDPHVGNPTESGDTSISRESVFSASIQTPLSDQSKSAGGNSRMIELRVKHDRIRLEKEKLLKLQELDELEASVQKEIFGKS